MKNCYRFLSVLAFMSRVGERERRGGGEGGWMDGGWNVRSS